jgi:electron transfer flavoprotein alpha subunit
MTILVIAEHDNSSLHAASLPTIAAAQAVGGDIHVLVAGSGASNVATQASQCDGVAKVLYADDAAYTHQTAENVAALIVSVGKSGYSHIIAPASFFGKNILPRAAALLDSQQISDITQVVSADTFVRPIYAGNAFATVQTSDAVKVITVRPTAFDAVAQNNNAAIENISSAGETGLTSFVSQEIVKSSRPDLGTAKIVISGGRGVGSGENFAKIIDPLADKLGAAVGASRAAVDAGYVPNDMQVGQTGKIVAPSLYIAVGISGAIQHLAGMKDSKVIVAINKDPEAPIFQIADYGLVGDLFEIVPALEKAI